MKGVLILGEWYINDGDGSGITETGGSGDENYNK